jgi:hypothetical protein
LHGPRRQWQGLAKAAPFLHTGFQTKAPAPRERMKFVGNRAWGE